MQRLEQQALSGMQISSLAFLRLSSSHWRVCGISHCHSHFYKGSEWLILRAVLLYAFIFHLGKIYVNFFVEDALIKQQRKCFSVEMHNEVVLNLFDQKEDHTKTFFVYLSQGIHNNPFCEFVSTITLSTTGLHASTPCRLGLSTSHSARCENPGY